MQNDQAASSATPLSGEVAMALSKGVLLSDGVTLRVERSAAGMVQILLDLEAGGQLRIEPNKLGIDIFNSIAPWLKTALGFEKDQAPLDDSDIANPQIWVSIDHAHDDDLTFLATAKADGSNFELETEPSLGEPGLRDDRAYFGYSI